VGWKGIVGLFVLALMFVVDLYRKRSRVLGLLFGREVTIGVVLAWTALLGLLAILAFGLGRAQQGPIRVGSQAPEFSLKTFDGEMINLADLQGRVVVVNFWASWCQPCEEEAPYLQQAYEEFKEQGVVFLGVDYVDTEPEARAYLERLGITYPNGPDLGTRISQAFRIRGVPETYIVSPEGVLVDVRIGPYVSLAEVRGAIKVALGLPQ
jgi:cytochrome c biogenesis protein CcmG/thiol:disulfide interchange protein DsbE